MKKIKVKTTDGDEVTRLVAESKEDERILMEMLEKGEDEYNPGLGPIREPKPAPMCMICKHKFKNKRKCQAFPEGIPWDIYSAGYDHRQPWDGDRGIRFEPIDEAEWNKVKSFYEKK